MAYSYSAIKEFQQCPRKYNECRILKKWPSPKTVQILYGEEVHKALEDGVKSGVPLGPHSRFDYVVDTIEALPGSKITEHKMALNDSLEPCDFFAPDVFMRGVADITVLNGTKAYVGDYKTGKASYPDPKQLELMALMLFSHYKEVETISASLLFLLYDKVVSETYKREEERERWVHWINETEKIETAVANGVFNEIPTPLCGWCPVKTCPHNIERK